LAAVAINEYSVNFVGDFSALETLIVNGVVAKRGE
jgi:hypothetical protein